MWVYECHCGKTYMDYSVTYPKLGTKFLKYYPPHAESEDC